MNGIIFKAIRFAPIVVLFVFLAFFLFNGITSLGLEYDELLSSNAALWCPNKTMFIDYTRHYFGRCIPIMLMDYIGAPIALIPAISLRLFGTSVISFRGFNMFVVLSSIFWLFIFLRKRFSLKAAFLTVLFLAFDVQFIFTQQLDRPTVFPFLLRIIFLYFWLSPGYKLRFLYLGILSGLMIYTKLDAVFFLAAVYISKGVLLIPEIKNFGRSFKKTLIHFRVVGVQFLTGFFFGIAPLLVFLKGNLQSVLDVMAEYKRHTAGLTPIIRVDSFLTQLTNGELFEYVFQQDISLPGVVTFGTELLAFFWLIGAVYLLLSRKFAWIGLTTIAFFVIYLFYPTLQGAHHRLLIYPFPQLSLAIFLGELSSGATTSFLNKVKRYYFVAICVVVYVLTFIPIYTQTTTTAAKTCGKGSFNCAIYAVVDQIKGEKETVIIGDWGIATQVVYLTRGVVPVYEMVFDAWYAKIPEVAEKMEPYLKKCSLVVLRVSERAKFVSSDRNIRAVLGQHPSYSSIIINDKNQIPQYEIFKSSACL